MSDLPDPLTPLHYDLRDFPYMPLDVVRLRDSEIAGVDDGEAFRAAVLLWCAAWHQMPAASLPDDDRTLCRLAGYGRDRAFWQRARDGGALRGWVKCSDGRLYHPVVAEKAHEAWEARCAQRARTEAARAARAANRTARLNEQANNPLDTSVTETVAESKGREGKGREGNITPPTPPGGLPAPRARACRGNEEFSEFYEAYPRKEAPDDALKAYRQCRQRGATHTELMAGLRRYAFSADPDKRPFPATWLRGGRWKGQSQTEPDQVATAPPRLGPVEQAMQDLLGPSWRGLVN